MARLGVVLRKSARGQGADPAVDKGEVAQVAYELYEQRGRADGYDFEDWLKAEAIVRQRRAASSR